MKAWLRAAGGGIRRRREREVTENDEMRARDGAGLNTHSVAPRVSGSSPHLVSRPAPMDFVAMTEAALRDPGIARNARRRGGLFDDDNLLPGAAAGGDGNALALRGKNGATGVGLFDDEEAEAEADKEENAPLDEIAKAAPATAASPFATRGLFESDGESDDRG